MGRSRGVQKKMGRPPLKVKEMLSPLNYPWGRQSRSLPNSAGGIREMSPVPCSPSGAWAFHSVLVEQLQRRGINCASLVALRVVAVSPEAGLQVLLSAFWSALQDASEVWALRHKKSAPVGAGSGGLVGAARHR